MSKQKITKCKLCGDYHEGQKGHHCPDWDFMFIRPSDREMGACLCKVFINRIIPKEV